MTLLDDASAEDAALRAANGAFSALYPGDSPARQPVHTFYAGAQHYQADSPQRLGREALASLDAYAPDALTLARGVGFLSAPALARLRARALEPLIAELARDGEGLRRREPEAWLALAVHDRVRAKLTREPIEDYRIDFEDGFGARPDAEEDEAARSAGREVARAMAAGLLPPFIGIRIKSFGEEWKRRGARTLELFVDTLLGESGGRLPDNFVVTLPKVTVPEQPRLLVRLLELLEERHHLAPGSLRLEIMIEVTQALLDAHGRSPLSGFLAACAGRCTGAHFGTYDFTASCGITAAYQGLDHPLCDLARGLMVLAYAGTGIALSDGATNVMPVGPHAGESLSPSQRAENQAAVHTVWQLCHRHIRNSLRTGFYQGWDLHPAQLPVRYATCFAFFLEGMGPAGDRLRSFVEKASEATVQGEVFDDVATGQGLLNYFLRALNAGAITLDEAALTGLHAEELGLRSFAGILQGRRRP